MEQMETRQTFRLSPAFAAFAVLVIVMGLIGIYVNDTGIETRGVTVIESALPLRYQDGTTGLIARYPNGWRAANEGGQVVFTLTDDRVATMALQQLSDGDVAENIAAIEANASEVIDSPEDFTRTGVEGESITVRETVGANQLDTRYIVFRDENDDLFLAYLQVEAGEIDRYNTDFEYFVQAVQLTQALPLGQTATRENIALSIDYPEGWTDQRDINLPDRILVVEDPEIATSTFYRFDVVPAEDFGFERGQVDTRSIAELIVEQPGITTLTDYRTVNLGGFDGTTIDLFPENDPDQRARFTVLDLTDGSFLVILARGDADGFYQLGVTLDAMLETLVYGDAPEGTDRVNDIRSGEGEEPSGEGESQAPDGEEPPVETETSEPEGAAPSQEGEEGIEAVEPEAAPTEAETEPSEAATIEAESEPSEAATTEAESEAPDGEPESVPTEETENGDETSSNGDTSSGGLTSGMTGQ